MMAYDVALRHVHIYLTYKDSRDVEHWVFDWQGKGYWPQSLTDTYEPTSIMAFRAEDALEQNVLLGSRDGYLRKWDRVAETDDSSTISSYVKITPPRFAGPDEGVLQEITGVMSETSGPAAWSVRPGTTHEEAVSSTTAQGSGTWTAGRNYREHQRVRHGAMVIQVANSGARQWQFERAEVVVETGGPQRTI